MSEREVQPVRLDVYRTSIPMRSFEHTAASRSLAEAVVTRLELSDGRVGWGETLPREYVTGETIDGVVADLAERIWPAFVEGMRRGIARESPGEFEALIQARAPDGRCMNAASCALDVAAAPLLMGMFGPASGRGIGSRVSGVLGSSNPARTAKHLRLMRLFGLRDFKLKLGLGEDADAQNLRVACRQLGRGMAKGACTLRVDVNGGWDADETPRRVAELKAMGVCAVEQPVSAGAGELVELAGRCELPLIADESLLTAEDGEILLACPQRIWWNVRISKNGGLSRALRLAEMAAAGGATVIVGCMVGESGILSAAQRRLLQAMERPPRFVEGNYGRFLLAGDLTARSPRFGYGGRLKALRGPGLGVRVSEAKLARYGKLLRTLEA